jgi:hypothetical protein
MSERERDDVDRDHQRRTPPGLSHPIPDESVEEGVLADGRGLVLTSLRFSQSRRRICAPWGVVAALLVQALLLALVWLLAVIFFENAPAAQLEPRRLLARNATDLLPALTFLTYMAVLAWGLLSRSKPTPARKRALQLAGASVIFAIPSLTAALWFIWRA